MKKVVDSNPLFQAKRAVEIKAWYMLIPVYILGTIIMAGLVTIINPPNLVVWMFMLGPLLWWSFFVIHSIHLFRPKSELINSLKEHKNLN